MWWKWLLGIAAVPLGAATIAYGIGAMLPVAHVTHAERFIPAPPELIGAIVRDVEKQPSWRNGVSSIEVTGRQGESVRYVEHQGRDAIAFELVEEARDRRFVSTITDDQLPFGGRWIITLKPEGSGTIVGIQEQGEINAPLYRFFATLIFGFDSTMKSYLAGLERSVATKVA